MRYGESCRYGNRYGRYGWAEGCDDECTGDWNQLCSGNNANSVHATGIRP